MRNYVKEKVKEEEKNRRPWTTSKPTRKINNGPAEELLALYHTTGNHAIGQVIQAKLKIRQPDDPLEKEADRVADQIVQMKEPAIHASDSNVREATKTSTQILKKPGPVNSATYSPVSNNLTRDLGVLPENAYCLIFLTFFGRYLNLKSLVIVTAEET